MSNQKEFYQNVTLTDDNKVETTVTTDGTGIVNVKNQTEFFRLISVTNNKINIKVI